MSVESANNYSAIFSSHFLTVDQILSTISSDRFFEFGASSQPLQDVYQKLLMIHTNMDTIINQFGPNAGLNGGRDLAFMNKWFRLRKKLSDTLKWIKEIDRKKEGSRNQTLALKKHLREIDTFLHEAHATLTPVQ